MLKLKAFPISELLVNENTCFEIRVVQRKGIGYIMPSKRQSFVGMNISECHGLLVSVYHAQRYDANRLELGQATLFC